ncbi:MAG: hypothetical protein IT198_00450 [Acidimicrobiia bacterium]|nr:hypothetical protein [Acidimicrobiia bacterium]
MSTAVPRPEHPRPDRRRDRWVKLNGPWDFSFGRSDFDLEIVVPFAYQSAAGGIATDAKHEVLWYRRTFETPRLAPGEHVLIHFGAVDFAAEVWVNDVPVGAHRGGHTPFTCDVTTALVTGSNSIVVRAVDEFRADQIRGKQTATFPHLVHYTPTSGIWQPVWLEVVGERWIRDIHVTARADGYLGVRADVSEHAAGDTLRVHLARSGEDLVTLESDSRVELEGLCDQASLQVWSPSSPALYDLEVELVDRDGTVLDTVRSYAGFRTLETAGGRWLLNGDDFYQRLVLDQGYWPGGLLTPPTDDAMRADIEFVRRAGFDGVRKHQKIEDPRWLYWADALGVVVWEEMPSPFWLGMVRGDLEADLRTEWAEAVRRDRNHPCVVCWVPFNESWGIQGVHDSTDLQALVRSVVDATRALDATRPVCDNSGWCHVSTDVVDVHDYEPDPDVLARRWTDIAEREWDRGPVSLAVDGGEGFDPVTWLRHVGIDDPADLDPEVLRTLIPVMDVWSTGCAPDTGPALMFLSEFGGIGLAAEQGPQGDTEDRFTYGTARDADELLARFSALAAAAESVTEFRGWCWTQLADVEQEVNGLLRADHSPKLDPDRIRAVIEGLSPRT